MSFVVGFYAPEMNRIGLVTSGFLLLCNYIESVIVFATIKPVTMPNELLMSNHPYLNNELLTPTLL